MIVWYGTAGNTGGLTMQRLNLGRLIIGGDGGGNQTLQPLDTGPARVANITETATIGK